MNEEIEELAERVHDLTEELILSDQRLEEEKEKYIKEKEEEMIECPICKGEYPDLEAHFEESPECKEAFEKIKEEKALRNLTEDSLDSRSKVDWKEKATKEQKEEWLKAEKTRIALNNPQSQTAYVDKLFRDEIAQSLQMGNCPVCGLSAEEIRVREQTDLLLSKKEKQELSDFTMGIGNWISWLESQTKVDVRQVRENKALSDDLIQVQIHLQAKHPKTAKILEKIFSIGKSGSGNTKADDDTHVREVKLAEKLSKRESLNSDDRKELFRRYQLSLRRKKKGDK